MLLSVHTEIKTFCTISSLWSRVALYEIPAGTIEVVYAPSTFALVYVWNSVDAKYEKSVGIYIV